MNVCQKHDGIFIYDQGSCPICISMQNGDTALSRLTAEKATLEERLRRKEGILQNVNKEYEDLKNRHAQKLDELQEQVKQGLKKYTYG